MRILSYIFIVFALVSCDGYQKVLKSNDMDVKFLAAKNYYENGEYVKALPLLDELSIIYKGTKKAQEVDYLLAYTYHGLGSNMIASYRFKLFVLTYPNSKHCEELSFMAAYCYYLESPSATKDMTNTLKAIDELQLFVDTYPDSKRVQQCNNLIDELIEKIHTKSYKIAKLYYDIEEYKAAITALNNLVIDYPTIQNKSEIQYLILDSNYKLAINSVLNKKEERFKNTIASYNYFKTHHADDELMSSAQSIYDKTLKQLQKIQQ